MAEHEWSTELDAKVDRFVDVWAGIGIPTPGELGMKEAVELFKDSDLQDYFEALDACR